MDDDYFRSNIQLNSNLINNENGEINEVAVNAVIKSNNEILLRAVEEYLQNISSYFNNSKLSDVVICVGNKRYYAHKFILAKMSDVFYTMLYKKEWSSTTTPSTTTTTRNDDSQLFDEIRLVETEECELVFEKFLKFFYTAEILITSDEVVGLLYLADKYNVYTLRNLASQYMMIKAKSPNVKNAVSWYAYAKEFKLNDLKEVCMKTIAWNTEYLLDSDEWLDVDIEFVKDLLNDSDLVISNEMKLYKSISKWLLYDCDRRKENFEAYANELIPLIRFSQMLGTQLFEIEKSDLAKNELCSKLIVKQLAKAYRFRVLDEILFRSLMDNQNLTENDKSNELEFINNIWYLPREYTELNLVDIVDMQNRASGVGIQADVKMYKGIAPKLDKTADWKVWYRICRSNSNRWSITVRCTSNALINSFCKAKVTAIVYNTERSVLQVEHGRTFTFDSSNSYEIDLNLCYPYESKELYLLIKPVLF